MGIINEIADAVLSILTLILFIIAIPLMCVGRKIGDFAESLPCSLAREFKGDLETNIRIKLK